MSRRAFSRHRRVIAIRMVSSGGIGEARIGANVGAAANSSPGHIKSSHLPAEDRNCLDRDRNRPAPPLEHAARADPRKPFRVMHDQLDFARRGAHDLADIPERRVPANPAPATQSRKPTRIGWGKRRFIFSVGRRFLVRGVRRRPVCLRRCREHDVAVGAPHGRRSEPKSGEHQRADQKSSPHGSPSQSTRGRVLRVRELSSYCRLTNRSRGRVSR